MKHKKHRAKMKNETNTNSNLEGGGGGAGKSESQRNIELMIFPAYADRREGKNSHYFDFLHYF